MTGIAETGGAAALRVLITRGAPAGWRWISSILHGKSVVVLGPPAAGKTTFVRFLERGVFLPESPHERTRRLTDSRRFQVDIGRGQNFTLHISRVTDIPGQDADPAEYVANLRPQGMVLVLDWSSIETQTEGVDWLDDFLLRLDQLFLAAPRKARFRTVMVLLNKVDKIQFDTGDSKTLVKARVDAGMRTARGTDLQHVTVRDCCLVDNPRGLILAETVVADLAIRLTEN